MDSRHRFEVMLEENPARHPAFPEDIWRIAFKCPYCRSQARASFSEKMLRMFVRTLSHIGYSCECQAWTGFNVFLMPKTFIAGATITIETCLPEQSP